MAENDQATPNEYMNRVDGLDYDESIAHIRENPEKIEQYWIDNVEGMARTGNK